MLNHDPKKARADISCKKCEVKATIPAKTFEDAWTAARVLGWQDRALKGKPRPKWDWVCPACQPGPSTTMGRIGQPLSEEDMAKLRGMTKDPFE